MSLESAPMNEVATFVSTLKRISERDSRYREEAYFFVMTSLSRALRGLKTPRHVTGAELLAAIQEEARHQFGPMAATVFEHWGMKNSLDFGRIVFNMVQEGILSKTETDALQDFTDEHFFEKLFDEFLEYRFPDETKTSKV